VTKLLPLNLHHTEDLANAFKFLTLDEVRALQTVVALLPDYATVVNIGAGSGTSGMAIVEERPDLRSTTWTIDISRGGPNGGLQNEVNAFDNARLPIHNQILDDSRHAAAVWENGPVDLAFIDDGHLDPEIRGDINGWLPHIKPGAYIAFHDYGSPFWGDVKKVVDELMASYEVFMQIDTLIVFRVTR
jgi:hypothetical protein